MAPQKAEVSPVTMKAKRIRKDNGRIAAIAATKMTREQWLKFQTEKCKKAWPKPAYMNEEKPFVHIRDGGEGAYRDETFAIVTRWTEKTKIQYRPHAKAPGSKSHIRYEKYAKATTVGQALKLGSYPMDWCFDYEHGFIKVVGGPARDEPIDPSQVDDLKKLTEVDRIIMQWYKRELAKKFGLSLQELAGERGQSEGMLIRAHRLVAERYSAEFLAKAAKEKRAVKEEELEEAFNMWGFQRNPNRVNVFPDGKDWVWSDNLGLVRDRHGDIHLTYATKRYPNFISLVTSYLTSRLAPEVKDFKFTSLNLNCNYAAKRHRDGNNFGPSMIKAFGEFSGGVLSVFPNDDKSKELEQLPESDRAECNIKENLAMFNGNSAHEVSDFTGKRLSIVYFTASCHAKAKPADIAELTKLGFPYPAPNENPFSWLPAPAGYKSSAKKKGMVRLWSVKKLKTKPCKAAPSKASVATKSKGSVMKKPSAA